eukprot:TRINITY_DN85762_c0_g1_i1.p1 TRINITY_DN85762_c0_g1~~TRINITY_DN85762_c0_g1_i1.p1  ORF type:complete len:465 (-),score=58.97 TRINITY_DN85762_c0_g1_i1:278-1672(-)
MTSAKGMSSTEDTESRARINLLNREMHSMEHSFKAILKYVEEERNYLYAEREKLEREQQSFDEMKKRIEDVNRMKSTKVKLNVGGQIFDTSKETLTCEEGSMLEAMFSGRFSIDRDEDGASFIDRDPTYFPFVLGYLREKKEGTLEKSKGGALVSVGSSIQGQGSTTTTNTTTTTTAKKMALSGDAVEKVLKEAKFYGLDGLEKLIIASTSLIVAQDGSSKYMTIQQALVDANHGDRILVQPGTYQESLVIEKHVHIEGEGNRDKVIVSFTGDHVVTSMTDKGCLKNFTLHQQGEEYHCLFITKGCLVVENCTFNSGGWACVGISGELTHPILRGNTIQSSADNGIIILSKGKGIIEDNDIYGYTLQGIEIREESNPIIRNNHIHDGKDSGIYINTKGRGLIEGNHIYSNEFNGIAIKFEGQPRVHNNKIHKNKQRGVYVSSDSKADIEGNDVFGNGAGDIVEE